MALGSEKEPPHKVTVPRFIFPARVGKEVNRVTVTIHLKGGVKRTYSETAVMDDVEARRCILASGVTTGNRRNLQGRERNHYGFAEDSHIAYDWRDVDRIEIAR